MKEKERMLIKVAGRSLQFSVFIKFSICLIRGSSGSCHNVILSLMTKGATIQFRRRNSLKISNHVIWLALCNIFLVRTLSQPLEKIDENVPKGCPPKSRVILFPFKFRGLTTWNLVSLCIFVGSNRLYGSPCDESMSSSFVPRMDSFLCLSPPIHFCV